MGCLTKEANNSGTLSRSEAIRTHLFVYLYANYCLHIYGLVFGQRAAIVAHGSRQRASKAARRSILRP